MSGETIRTLYREVEEADSRAATANEALAAEREAHSATKKQLAVALAREAKLKAKLDQRGPVDSLDESWLMAHSAVVTFRRSPSRGELVTVEVDHKRRARGKKLDDAIAELRGRLGER